MSYCELVGQSIVMYEEDPAQIFCECGEPIKLWDSKFQLPIVWLKDACDGCKGLDSMWRKRKTLDSSLKENDKEIKPV